MRQFLVMATVLSLLLGACSSDGAETTATTGGTSSETTAATPDTSAPTETTTSSPSDDPVQAQLDWVVRAMNGSPLSEEVYAERFAEQFRAQVPFEEQFLPGMEQMRAVTGDWLLVRVDQTDATSAVAVAAAGEERVRISISIDPESDGRIAGLLFQPGDLPSTPDSMENAIGRLEDQGDLAMLGAEVVDGACRPIVEVDAADPVPIGSVFKLYVLGSLGSAIEAGDVSWDDEVVIRDELKSIPTGILQDEPDGTVKTVEEVARLMISISDNTATDHLIDLLGRERIEGDLAALGMAAPERNIPLLTTMDFAALKVGPAAGLRQQYLDADTAGRRAIIEQISDIAPQDIPTGELTEPIAPDTIEWFATPTDLCTTMATLWEMGGRTGLEPIREILTENPGMAADPELWDAIAFKGGSEPGLFAVAWLMERPDGRTFTLTGSVLDTEETIDEFDAAFVFAGARDLLAQDPVPLEPPE
jgi:beta-lactamase class A